MTEEALVREHAKLAYRIAGDYYVSGTEPEDLQQEALYALLIAVRTYDPTSSCPLGKFAAIVIRRWLQTCVRSGNTLKYQQLSHALRTIVVAEGEPEAILDHLPAFETTERVVLARERLTELRGRMTTLSPGERQAIVGYVNGLTYAQTGPPKSVDNALVRARRKLAA